MSALTEGHCIGPYRIVRLLGQGGMGAVYEARQEPLDRRVALKTLHPQFAQNQESIARFFNEAKALSRLEHPSIVQVSDFGNAPDGTAYLVMEYLRGQSLGRRLRTGDGRLPVEVALQLAWQIGDVLAIAHAQGVVHRDLKPDNLMLVEDPVAPGGERVKVLDFGIAKLTHTESHSDVKTDSLAVMGTPMYMSPEQCTGAGGVDAKTDVYSLGCVLYQTLAGRPPFTAEGPGQLIGMHLFQEPQRLSSVAPKVPSQVVELVHRLLTKDKMHRPSMSQVTDELGLLLSKLASAGPGFRSRNPDARDPQLPPHVSQLATTLGQSIGQRSKVGTPRKQLIIAGLLGIGMVSAGAMAWRNHDPAHSSAAKPGSMIPPQQSAPIPPPPAMALQSSPVAAEIVRWELDSRPSGATILDETDQEIGTTPWRQEFVASSGMHNLRVRRDGYSEATVQVDRAASAKWMIKLKRIPTTLPRRTTQPTGQPTDRPSGPGMINSKAVSSGHTGLVYED